MNGIECVLALIVARRVVVCLKIFETRPAFPPCLQRKLEVKQSLVGSRQVWYTMFGKPLSEIRNTKNEMCNR